jgi:hypothetical protein
MLIWCLAAVAAVAVAALRRSKRDHRRATENHHEPNFGDASVRRAGLHGHEELMVREAVPQRTNVRSTGDQVVEVASGEVVYGFPPDPGVWPGVGVRARI